MGSWSGFTVRNGLAFASGVFGSRAVGREAFETERLERDRQWRCPRRPTSAGRWLVCIAGRAVSDSLSSRRFWVLAGVDDFTRE